MSRDRIIMLQECAEELGFSTIEEALDAGYHEVQDVDAGTFKLMKIDWTLKEADELEKAHEAWLKEQRIVLGDLMNLMVHKAYDHDIIERAYNFIKERCRD